MASVERFIKINLPSTARFDAGIEGSFFLVWNGNVESGMWNVKFGISVVTPLRFVMLWDMTAAFVRL